MMTRCLQVITGIFSPLSVSQGRVHLIGSRTRAHSREDDQGSAAEWKLGVPAELSLSCFLDVSHGRAHQDFH